MKKSIFESIEKTEDGWVGYLAEGYITDNETVTIFADTKKDLYSQAEIEGTHKMTEKEISYYKERGII